VIKIENTAVQGFKEAIRGMRNPMNSWDKSDSSEVYLNPCDTFFEIGDNDQDLMMRLAKNGPVYAKYRREIIAWFDVTAPLYWWKEADTYKVGTVCNSCSTMHTIHKKEFEYSDFSHEHLTSHAERCLMATIETLNWYREEYIAGKEKDMWWQLIQLLPSSYNQRRSLMMSYEVLANIYATRKDHKLDEWRYFCRWIENLPHSEVITL